MTYSEHELEFTFAKNDVGILKELGAIFETCITYFIGPGLYHTCCARRLMTTEFFCRRILPAP